MLDGLSGGVKIYSIIGYYRNCQYKYRKYILTKGCGISSETIPIFEIECVVRLISERNQNSYVRSNRLWGIPNAVVFAGLVSMIWGDSNYLNEESSEICVTICWFDVLLESVKLLSFGDGFIWIDCLVGNKLGTNIL